MMLAKQGIIKPEEAENILRGLKGILEDIENGSLRFDDSSKTYICMSKASSQPG